MNAIHAIPGSVFRWVLQTSWQAAVLAVLVLVVQLIFRKKLSAGWRYGLWLLVILRLVMPAIPQTAFSVFNFTRLAAQKPVAASSQTVAADTSPKFENRATAVPSTPVPDEALRFNGERANNSQASAAVPAPAISGWEAMKKQPVDWLDLLCIAWLAGVVAMSLSVMLAGARFRARMANATPVSDVNALRLVRECARSLGMRQRVIVIETAHVDSPSVWGLWRKRLLLPRGSLERFSVAELRHIFLHELAHLKRRDLEVNWLAGILQILHWFNPVLWFAFARMRADRELATDALALKHASGSEDVRYGETILKVLEGLSGNPLRHGLVGIAESKARMKERLVAIVNRRASRPWRWAAAGIAAALAVAGLTDAQQNRSKESNEAEQKQFTLRVVDIGSVAPLSGVTVEFTLDFYGGSSNKQQVITGQNGRATVEFNPDKLKHLSYQASKADYLLMRGELFDQEIPAIGDEFKFDMAQGTEIGGTVTDDKGNPLAGAEISVDETMNLLVSAGHPGVPDHAETWYQPSGERIAVTDASGHWKAKCIWPTMQWASLRIHQSGFADVTCATDTTSAMEAEGKGMRVDFADLQSGKMTVRLPRGKSVTGHVVDENGNPLKEIRVDCAELLVEPNRADRLTGHYTATTDASGQFRFEHMPSKYLYFSIERDGYAPVSAELDVKSSAASEVVLHLTTGQEFLGRIVDNHDNPVAGAHVSLADFSIWRGFHWESVADANGRIEWAYAPAGKFELQIEKDGYITQKKIVQVTDNQETKIRVNPTLRIAGQVLDGENKQPVQNFHIDWLDRSDPRDFEQRYPYVTIAGSNGAYAVDLERLYGNTWAGGYAHQCLLRVQADGYAPFISRVFSSSTHDVGEVAYDIELKRESQIFGEVVDGEGRPVAGAQVALKVPGIRWLLTGSEPFLSNAKENEVHLTDLGGRFHFNADPEARGLVAVSDKGFGSADTNEFSTNMTVRLRPWGRLEGVVWDYDKLVTNQQVWGSAAGAPWPESMRVELRTNSDDHGRFAFPFMPPGKYRVYRMIPMPGGRTSGGSGGFVQVDAGQAAFVKLGSEGRPVIGRFNITNEYMPIDWQDSHDFETARSVTPQVPEGLKTREEFEAWRNRPEIEKAFDEMRSYPIQIAADGSFRMDEVVPGKYAMTIQMYDPRDPDAMAYSKYIINTEKSFEVPASDSRAPFDIGTIDIGMTAEIRKGQTAAQDFEGTDVDGKKFKLSDFRGKYVLLDFWASWCGPCIAEFPYLRQVHDKFKDRQNFVMLSVSIDRTADDWRGFLKKNDMPWMQGFLGGESGVPSGYGAQGIPAIYLVNPEGKIIDADLSGGEMVQRVGDQLARAVTYKTN